MFWNSQRTNKTVGKFFQRKKFQLKKIKKEFLLFHDFLLANLVFFYFGLFCLFILKKTAFSHWNIKIFYFLTLLAANKNAWFDPCWYFFWRFLQYFRLFFFINFFFFSFDILIFYFNQFWSFFFVTKNNNHKIFKYLLVCFDKIKVW